MATRTNTQPDVRFLVDVFTPHYSHSRDYLIVKVQAVYVSDGHIRNPHFSTYDPEKVGHLDSFVIEGQASKDSQDFYYSGHRSAQYREIYSVELPRAESMTKTLRRIAKYLDQRWEINGEAQDFAEFCEWVARALGVKRQNLFAIKIEGHSGTYDENVYHWLSTDEFRTYLANKLTKWQEAA